MEIVINGMDNLSDDLKSQLITGLKEYIKKDLSSLNLCSLENLYITDFFGEDISKVRISKGLIDAGYTDTVHGRAVGKTINYIDNGEFKSTVLMYSPMAAGWFFPGQKERAMSTHLLHHELCHVHDDHTKFLLFGETYSEDPLINFYRHFSNILWSEYFAVRKSTDTLYFTISEIDSVLDITMLFDLINDVKQKLDKALINYDEDKDMSLILSAFLPEINLLMKTAVTVIGNRDGLLEVYENHENLVKFFTQFEEDLKKTYFYEIWKDLGEQLKFLYEIYPNWENQSIFNVLSKIMILTFLFFGLQINDIQNGIFYCGIRKLEEEKSYFEHKIERG